MRDLAPLCTGQPCAVTVCGGSLEMPRLTWAEKGLVTLLQVYGARGCALTLEGLLAISADGAETCRALLSLESKRVIAFDDASEAALARAIAEHGRPGLLDVRLYYGN